MRRGDWPAGLPIELLLEGARIGQTGTVGAQEIVAETRMLCGPGATPQRVRCRPGHAGHYVLRAAAMVADLVFSPGYGLRDVDCDAARRRRGVPATPTNI